MSKLPAGKDRAGRWGRIAYLTSEYPAISHTFILREVEALRELGLEVLTCSIRRTPPDQHLGPAERAAAADTFHVLDAVRNPLALLKAQLASVNAPKQYFGALGLALKTRSPGLRALVYQLIYFLEATVLAHQLQEKQIPHLHNHFASSSATVAMLAAKIAGISYSYTLHGPADFEDPRRWRLDVKTAEAAFVACISNFARSQAMLHSDPGHWSKLHIVHCGVIPELYRRSDGAQSEDRLKLVFVGRLAAVKGLRVLTEAFVRAAEHVNGLHLTVVGDGSDRAWLEQAATRVGGAIELAGYCSQQRVAEILAASDALVLPSFAEGVPVVLMEAMAAGKPVVATQVAGVPELVEDGVNGFLVAPGNPEMLADRIERLADPALRARLGAAGRAKVAAEFDARGQAAILKKLFDQIV